MKCEGFWTDSAGEAQPCQGRGVALMKFDPKVMTTRWLCRQCIDLYGPLMGGSLVQGKEQ